jgi:D-arabinose 1-dehydrogenase-like Zn-dependent alcohol dehydrogenase
MVRSRELRGKIPPTANETARFSTVFHIKAALLVMVRCIWLRTVAIRVITPFRSHMENTWKLALAEAGMIEAEMTYFGLHAAVSVYARLEKGEIQGRAVFVPV